jgi:hypothetical protein
MTNKGGQQLPEQTMPNKGGRQLPEQTMPNKGGQLPEYAMPNKGGMQLPEQVAPCQGGIFVPVQPNGNTVTPEQALEMGTAFPCLYSPYEKGETSCG